MRRPDAFAQRLLGRLLADGLVLAALALWWLTARGLPRFVLPGPWDVCLAMARLFGDRAFIGHTAASTLRVVASVLIAVTAGFALAVAADRVGALQLILQRRILPVLNSFPAAAWAILVAIWLPPDDLSVILVQVLILLPFCLINLTEGLRALDRDAVEMAWSFTRSRRKVILKILLPLLLPYLIAAIRISYGIAWKVALVSELFGADTGLGYLMLRAQVSSDSAMVFATCFAIVLIFVAGEKLVIDKLARLVPAP